MEVAGGVGGDDGSACALVVVFVDDIVAFDVLGFSVTGIPHIFD
jgi:hypothetical protein